MFVFSTLVKRKKLYLLYFKNYVKKMAVKQESKRFPKHPMVAYCNITSIILFTRWCKSLLQSIEAY